MNWSVAEAKEQLSEVLRRAELRPQTISRRNRAVAVVLSIGEYRQLEDTRHAASRRSLGAAFAELRDSAQRSRPALPTARRRKTRLRFIPEAR